MRGQAQRRDRWKADGAGETLSPIGRSGAASSYRCACQRLMSPLLINLITCSQGV
jgi:hypothetical protein